ncbi:MAG: tetratricopeptide repeat protein [candidate division WOR-3 bacterium]|jgi:tetratricopeptide (TPR) repeat protein
MEDNLQNQNPIEEQTPKEENIEISKEEVNYSKPDEIENKKIEEQKSLNLEKIEEDLKEFLKQVKDSSDSVTNNFKETLLRFEAINETISVLPEMKELIKNNSDGSKEQIMVLESKLENISNNLDNIVKLISEEKDNIKLLIDNFNEKNQNMFTKMDSLISNLEKISETVLKVVDYEENLSKKRETEFAMMQAKIYNERGLLLFYRGIFSTALNYFLKANELDPTSPEIYNNIAQTYLKLGNQQKAEENFKKAIEIFPDFAEVYNNLGLMYLSNNQFELASENFKKAIDLNPDFSEAYLMLGNAFHSLKKYDDAVKNWSKALEINPYLEEAKEKLKIIKEGEINV